MGTAVLATIRHQQPPEARTGARPPLAFVGDCQVVRALRDMPHKVALDSGKAGSGEHLLLLLPGGMDRSPAHLAILIIHPRPEQRLTKSCQGIRIGEA